MPKWAKTPRPKFTPGVGDYWPQNYIIWDQHYTGKNVKEFFFLICIWWKGQPVQNTTSLFFVAFIRVSGLTFKIMYTCPIHLAANAKVGLPGVTVTVKPNITLTRWHLSLGNLTCKLQVLFYLLRILPPTRLELAAPLPVIFLLVGCALFGVCRSISCR